MPQTIAYLSLGSNLGNRAHSIHSALTRLASLPNAHSSSNGPAVRVIRTSFLYESAPMYLSDQPSFLNCACMVETTLSPTELLAHVKSIEKAMGRVKTVQYGPRVIDIDIISFGSEVANIQHEDKHQLDLQIPHPRLHEREFVLRPLSDMDPNLVFPSVSSNNRRVAVTELLAKLMNQSSGKSELRRVMPLAANSKHGAEHLIYIDTECSDSSASSFGRGPLICGILNATQDSFSDGHNNTVSDRAKLLTSFVDRVNTMVREEGADLIDIGGESTRPGATVVSVDEELERVIPLIETIRRQDHEQRTHWPQRLTISIDTRNSAVARAAIDAGADIVNDVSAGRYDPHMISTVAARGVPMIFMHSRGTPIDMMSTAHTSYGRGSIVDTVADELSTQLEQATRAGVPLWNQIVDPGIGFSKLYKENVALLHPTNIQLLQHKLGNRPIMIGASRKRFIQEIFDREHCNTDSSKSAMHRDIGTAAVSCAAAMANVLMIRVHNVRANRQALAVFRSVMQSKL
jgi:dihydroneopterin aldolase/2-amino-4-hydroxy-6-hydroxymethyldihydropteridine diphosphokinase/dihydropteroate synthase